MLDIAKGGQYVPRIGLKGCYQPPSELILAALLYFAGTSTQGSPLPGSLPWVHHLA